MRKFAFQNKKRKNAAIAKQYRQNKRLKTEQTGDMEQKKLNVERIKQYRLRKKNEMGLKKNEIDELEKKKLNAERNKQYRLRKKIEMEQKRTLVTEELESNEEPICKRIKTEIILFMQIIRDVYKRQVLSHLLFMSPRN